MNIEMLKSLREKSEGMRILYVEDDENIRATMLTMMKKFIDHVTTAANGKEGLARYAEGDYDIVITDIAMPQMDGSEMLTEIKKLNPAQATVVTSAYGDKEHLLEFITIGVTKFIPKPISAAYFVESLYEVISNIYNTKKVEEYTRMLKNRLVESTSLLEQYKEAVDISSIVSKSAPDGTITYVNDAFCTISGYSREELIGQNHRIVRSPHMKASLFKEIWQRINAKKVWSGEVENRKKNGEPYYVYSTIIPILDVEGEIIEFISIRQDITALKKAQLEELSSSIDKAISINEQEMIEQIPLASVIVDEHSTILHKNSLFDRDTLFGFSEGENLRKHLKAESHAMDETFFDWGYCHTLCDSDEPQRVTFEFETGERTFSLFAKALQPDTALFLICLIPDERGE